MITLVLGFYSNQDHAVDVLRDLGRSRFRRAAAIYRPSDAPGRIRQRGFAPLQRGLFSFAALLLWVLAGYLADIPWLTLAGTAPLLFLAVWFAVRWLGFGVRTRYILQYKDLVLPGEALILVQAPAPKIPDVLSLLRGFGHPTTFVVRPEAVTSAEDDAAPRREPLTAERLVAHASTLAASHQVRPPSRKPQPLLTILRNGERTFEIVREELAEAARLDYGMTNAAEWLLDNAYIIRTHIADVRRNLPKHYYQILPTLAQPPGGRVTVRVYHVASELITGTDGRLNRANITEFLEAYQTVAPLTIAELWVFPLMLRLVLIEQLRQLALRVNRCQHQRERADFWANRLLNAVRRGPDAMQHILPRLKAESLDPQPHFIARLSEQLHEEEAALTPVLKWIEERGHSSLSDLVRIEHGQQAGDLLSIANAFGSLRELAQLDFKEIFETVSRVEAILRDDPAKVHARTDFQTRDRCRQAVEEIARYSKTDELDVARLAIELGASREKGRERHSGYYLIDAGRPELETRCGCWLPLGKRARRLVLDFPTTFYLGSVLLWCASLTAAAVGLAWLAGLRDPVPLGLLSLLAIFPLSQVAVQLVNAMVTAILPPRVLAKMSFEEGVPEECRTLVVVPTMLITEGSIRGEVEKLEVRYLANLNENLLFALLTDFSDAGEQQMPEDTELLGVAVQSIQQLNARYGGGRFLLFHRQRRWCETEQLWIGWERKRGKLEELNCFLNGEPVEDESFLLVGNLPGPVRYVITLDSDTQLPFEAGQRLIETIAHPLNQVEMTADGRNRLLGYSIIQPRVSITLPGATATRFTRLFTDTTGTDPYCQAVSDAYNDLFGEGIYLGKGIYDVRSFHRILSHRFPEQRLLSHDLIEGAYVGVTLASDIEVFEQFPHNYQSYSKRQHRWIRGDWQIAAWCLPRVPVPGGGRERNPLSIIDRWKIFDNLRRSLVAPASVLLLVGGWIPSAASSVWSGAVGLYLLLPALMQTGSRFRRTLQGDFQAWREAGNDATLAMTATALLPHQALQTVDAIVRVLYRRAVSRRHLLEWETAQMSHLSAGRHLNEFLLQTLLICSLSAVLALSLFHTRKEWPALPYLALWLLSPAVVRWIGAPRRERRAGATLTVQDRRYLRHIGRQTWRYFDDLVGPQSNWLPPDNSQESLRVEVAQRTSPTNIGLWLMSALAARDLGYLTLDQLIERVSATLDTIVKLDRYDGHLLNWYDIQTLEPLRPRYVSAVDSGNLLAALWTLEQGCGEILDAPILSQATLRGLADTLHLARENFQRDPAAHVPFRALSSLLRGRSPGAAIAERIRLAVPSAQKLVQALRWSLAASEERVYWVTRLDRDLQAAASIVDRYLRWTDLLSAPPEEFVALLGKEALAARTQALVQIPSIALLAGGGIPGVEVLLARRAPGQPPKLMAWLDELDREYRRARSLAGEMLDRYEDLIARIHELADGINMRLLYDPARRLFAIGCYPGAPIEGANHYDLLASEARLASLVSIAKGEVPVEHWLALGRPYTWANGRVLLSWSGTMFEYLMPMLFNKSFENSLLDHACRQAVRRQIEYGYERGIPWGLSESAFAALDAHQIYQYRAFGVPELGLKRGLEDDLVVAPYATALALMVEPGQAVGNLRRLEDEGLRGRMGFYESIDYTRRRERGGEAGVVVYAYMSHHQGMWMMSLVNALHQGVMQKRMHSDARIQAVEPLLYERIPATPPLLFNPSVEGAVPPALTEGEEPANRVLDEDTPTPRAHLLGNGNYSMMITNAGGGYSRWRDFDVTRWRADTTTDAWGSYCYIRELTRDGRGAVWSAAFHPLKEINPRYAAVFSADRVEFRRRESGIDSLLSVTVSPEDDAEVRRVSLTNRTLRIRQFEVTSYSELALAPHAAHRAHPAFSKLFIQTQALPELNALIAWRRPRSPEDPPVWVGQVIVTSQPPTGQLQYETDRTRFVGRGNDLDNPVGLKTRLGGSAGSVLDPVFCLRLAVTVEPRQRVDVAFITVAAESREGVIRLIEKYRDFEACHRAFELAWTHAQLEFRYLGIQADTAHRFQELAGHLLYPNARLRAPVDRLSRNQLPQSRLWAHGISGDLPILVVTIADPAGVPFVRELLLAHTFWRLRGFKADLVVLNQEAQGYDQPLHQQLSKLLQAHSLHSGLDVPGGIFLRKWEQIPDEDRTLLLTVARAVLGPHRGSLAQQLTRSATPQPAPPPAWPADAAPADPSPELPFLELPYFNGLGGFTRDGREYCIYLGPESVTPLPWINVLANPGFGTIVSESGSGFAWSGNSQSNRLTPWRNDPLLDPASEAIYLRDEDTGIFWTPTALPIRETEAYRARHGQGYTIFEHNSHGIEQVMLTFVPAGDGHGDPLRIQRLDLRNTTSRRRRLSVTFYADMVLGADPEDTQLHVTSRWDDALGALLCRNPYNPAYGRSVAFAALDPPATSFCGDRTLFLGRNGSPKRPAAMRQVSLAGSAGAGLDPCAALRVVVELNPGETRQVTVLFGQASDAEQARALIVQYRNPARVEQTLDETRRWWDRILSTIEVRTPVLSVDFLVNRWLLYQTLACRIWARSALYQSGGAFGFRDQLQDVLALVYAAPDLAREHILLAASRQFVEGDVQHWWHPPEGGGIRSRCSDDMLWLPFATARYVEVTGDESILDARAPFLEGPALKPDEHEVFFVPERSHTEETLFEHCRRAINRGVTSGPHGLPLIGSCDWNDGMSRVGIGGKGESVWLAWFAIEVLRSFAALCGPRGELALARDCESQIDRIAAAIQSAGWDGEWYRRAYFDDGTPLGSKENAEARIDSLPQSWAVISGTGDPTRAERAMDSVWRYLVRQSERLVLLYTPPFDKSLPHPGYIMGYPPGVRENGGQYTHAALWVAMAYARLGDGVRAAGVMDLLNPVEHARTAAEVAVYRGEPYVVAADVYALAGQIGRCGWTWYTGSSGWMYRIWIEEILGLKLRGATLRLQPALPPEWNECTVTLRYRSTTYEVMIENAGDAPVTVELDGATQAGPVLALVDDGKLHRIRVQAPVPAGVIEDQPV